MREHRFGFEKRTVKEVDYIKCLGKALDSPKLSPTEKMMNFPMYAPRQVLTTFLYKYELFKKILHVQGSIVECGVAFGSGLMTFAQLSAIFEPVNHGRRIIGFDTFGGFPHISEHDCKDNSSHTKVGGMCANTYEELCGCVDLYNMNRFVNHIEKVELVKGDALKTIPKYIKNNPQTIVALLYLDFDLYEPTKVAIKKFMPRMPKGSIIAFDELNNKTWSGVTEAVLEATKGYRLRIKRYSFDSIHSYAVLE